jgi:peptidylprolyl isomerase
MLPERIALDRIALMSTRLVTRRKPTAQAAIALLGLQWSCAVATAAAPTALDRELAEILELLPGRYVGEADDPRGGAKLLLHHKIVRIDAPQFGSDTVFYHLLARDGFDSLKPFQQKIYAFDRRPERVRNSMRSWVYLPTTPGSNLERDVARQRSLRQDELMNFPAETCAIRWSRGEKPVQFVARVKPQDCVFESAAFKQKIRPDMTYVLSAASFGIQDILNGENGQPLFPSSGISYAPRVSPAPGTMAAILADAPATDWRPLDPARSLYLEIPQGRVVFELAPQFAPRHAANLQRLVAQRYFDGLSINRVQDNFVVQWGDPADPASPTGPRPRGLGDAVARLEPEFTRAWAASIPFTALADADGYAPRVGFSEGFAVAASAAGAPTGSLWLAHCYGTLAVGRDVAANSGNAAELYVVIGQAPRPLDRNATVLGRAVSGIEWLASLPRGTAAMGFYEKPEQRVPIRSVRFGSELPPEQRAQLEVLRTESTTFARIVEARRNRRDEWYLQRAGHIDLCSVPIPVRSAPPGP